jgi:hypothetical protein
MKRRAIRGRIYLNFHHRDAESTEIIISPNDGLTRVHGFLRVLCVSVVDIPISSMT